MTQISSEIIYKCVKELCLRANTKLPKEDYLSLYNLYLNENNQNAKDVLAQILSNAQIAFAEQRPLCQDTGFVTVFLNIGQDVNIIGENINNTINKAISDAYNEYFLRKSIVNNPIERINTTTNTPALIHTQITDGDKIEITLSVKGGGCENVSAAKMLTPAQGLNGIKEFVTETVKNAGSKACPPIKIGIGIGSNFEGAAILSKKALISTQNTEYEQFENEMLKEVNDLNIGAMGFGGKSTCFGVKIMADGCHIASLPVAISISCHSSRHATAIITDDEIKFKNNDYDFIQVEKKEKNVQKINTNETSKIRELQENTQVLLSGKIYTARDAAHKKLFDLIKNNKKLPFNIKNAIIFYAGPCPNNENEIIGPIGPTTSIRMDKYTPALYQNGLLASIGKGDRYTETINSIKDNQGKYFTITGGVASLLKNCITSAKVIAYPELGAEAIYELEIKNLPITVKV